MKKVILEVCHLSNHSVDAVTQNSQIVNGAEVLQQKSMDCIKYVLHRSINGPVWCSEKVPVSPTGNHLQKNRAVIDIEIIHRKSRMSGPPIDCKLINDSVNECVHLE